MTRNEVAVRVRVRDAAPAPFGAGDMSGAPSVLDAGSIATVLGVARIAAVKNKRFGRGAGQSLVEFAVAAPVLLLLLLGMLDLGRGFYVREQVSDAARAALRLAISAGQQATGDTACASGGRLSTVLPASGGPLAGIAGAAAVSDSASGSPAGTGLPGATLTVTWHCVGSSAVTNATNQGVTDPADQRSDSVDVVLTYPLALLYPVIQRVAGPVVTVSAHEIGRVEY